MNCINKDVEILKLEYHHHKEIATTNLIEMGKRLAAIKEILPYGEFQKWIETESGISIRTSQMYMKVANEFKDTQPVSHLGIKKAYKLLSLPVEQRDIFIKTKDINNMSYSKLSQEMELFNSQLKIDEAKKKIISNFEQFKQTKIEIFELMEMYSDDKLKEAYEEDVISIAEDDNCNFNLRKAKFPLSYEEMLELMNEIE